MKKPMSFNPSVSILIPAKNASLYLAECLDSIRNQTISSWEVLIVDDHSVDETFGLMSSYAALDNRIKVFQNPGSGIIEALKFAHSHAKGLYISRMDADDIMMPNKLEILSGLLRSRGEGHIAVGCVAYFSQGELGEGYLKYADWLNGLTRRSANFQEIYKECVIPSPCWMVSKSDLEAAGAFNDPTYPEDYDLAFRFRKIGLKVLGTESVLHRWRDYPTRTSRTDENYADNRFTALKVHHFLDQDINPKRQLVVWGAGNKGKRLAKCITERRVNFNWICNNPSKIGKDIYGSRLYSTDALYQYPASQVLISVSSKEGKKEIMAMIEGDKKHQYYWFC